MRTSAAAAGIICTLSGGYDSVVALCEAMQQGPTLGLFVNYGQRYIEAERRAVAYVSRHVRNHRHFSGVVEVQAELGLVQGTPWIPYRNLVIAAVATNFAIVRHSRHIVFGSKSTHYRPNDPVSFLDSTVHFYDALNQLLRKFAEPHNLAMVPGFQLPCLGWDKKRVLTYLHLRGFDLKQLWNCYREDGGLVPCGTCPHCRETQPLIEAVATFGEYEAPAAGELVRTWGHFLQA